MTFAELLRPELAELSSYVPAEPPGIEVRLDANEAPPNAAPAVREAVVRAIGALPLERYPDARGRALKARLAERTGARADEILLGTGSDEVISLLATSLCRPRGRSPHAVVLSPSPTFVMYRVTARAHGLMSAQVPLDASWDLDVPAMVRAIELMSPNLVFVASPNNPTGNRMAPDRIEAIARAASPGLFVLDEAYVDFAGESLSGLRAAIPNLAVLRTLSKIGLAALRIGWLEGPEGLVREIDKARQPFNVSATSQVAAAAVLAEAWPDVQAHVARVVAERERLTRELARLEGVSVTPSAANFLWVRAAKPARELFDRLVARGVLVRSFHGTGGRMEHQLRVTVGLPHENDRFLEAFAEGVAS